VGSSLANLRKDVVVNLLVFFAAAARRPSPHHALSFLLMKQGLGTFHILFSSLRDLDCPILFLRVYVFNGRDAEPVHQPLLGPLYHCDSHGCAASSSCPSKVQWLA